MPADHDAMADAFANLTGHHYGQEAYPGHEAGGADEWIDLFSETGIDFPSQADTIDAFENFLVSFYPQEGMSADDWWYVREEFYEMYGIDEHSIDWSDYREAIGYGRD